MRPSVSRLLCPPLLAALTLLVTAGPAFAEFSRNSALAQARALVPNASLPSDALPASVTAYENIPYLNAKGTDLQLDIYRPDGRAPVPAVLIVHGGGWEEGSRQMERPLAQQLAARGFAAIPVSYRLGAKGRFPAPLDDLKAAVRWVRSHASDYGIDPTRIGAIGGSAGGQLVALLGASNGVAVLEGYEGDDRDYSSVVQAVVDIDGVADFVSYDLISQEEAKQGATSRYLGGPYSKAGPTWHQASATTYLSKMSAPCLFINSTVTHPILPGRSVMQNRLLGLGVYSKLIVIPDTPHPFWLLNPWFEQVLDDCEAFLNRYMEPRKPGTA